MKETFLQAARCPPTLTPKRFGAWKIEHRNCPADLLSARLFRHLCGGERQTALWRMTGEHHDEIVMEDSIRELSRHLPIWLQARGRILITGLGLGCVVRGLLASPRVEHIDVIELDPDIIDAVGPEFTDNPRVTIVQGDALSCPMLDERWDFAWHDIWCAGSGLQRLHVQLIHRFEQHCGAQGAWMLPRFVKRLTRWDLIG